RQQTHPPATQEQISDELSLTRTEEPAPICSEQTKSLSAQQQEQLARSYHLRSKVQALRPYPGSFSVSSQDRTTSTTTSATTSTTTSATTSTTTSNLSNGNLRTYSHASANI